MAGSQGEGYSVPPSAPPAPSAPVAPSAYSGHQPWQQSNYSSAPSSYSSAPSYNDIRAQYNSHNSFSSGRPPSAAPYADPQQLNTTYGQSPNTYGQSPSQKLGGYGQTQLPQSPYADPSKQSSSYQSQPLPSYGQPPPTYGQSQSSVYGHSQQSTYGQPPQSSSYGKPAQPTSYGQTASYGQTYGQPPQYSPAGSYPPSPYAYGQGFNQALKPKVQFPNGTDPEIIRAFEMGDIDGSGLIDASELGRVLSTGLPFSMRTVHLMLHLYSANGSLKIGPMEFASLWMALKEWKFMIYASPYQYDVVGNLWLAAIAQVCFERFDRDRSGRIDFNELRDGLLSMGYAISPPLLTILISKYDRTGQAKAMDYDNFVECGFVVKGLTDRFKAKDTRFTGSATLDYESFMQMVLPFIVA